MALVTRKHFLGKAAFAAAVSAIGKARVLFDADEQIGSPLDAAAIRKLSSEIAM